MGIYAGSTLTFNSVMYTELKRMINITIIINNDDIDNDGNIVSSYN